MKSKTGRITALIVTALTGAILLTSCSSSTILKPGNDENKTIDVSSVSNIRITEEPIYTMTERENWTLVNEETNVSAINGSNDCQFGVINNYTPSPAQEGWGDAFLSQKEAYDNRPNLINHNLVQVKATGTVNQISYFSGYIDEVAYLDGDKEVKKYGYVGYHVFAENKFSNDFADEDSNVVSLIEFSCPNEKDATLEEWEKSLESLEVAVK